MSTTPARPLPPEVRDKLGKLLPLLSSNHDGERAGAAFAIQRVLKSHGCDLYDLVAAITTATPAREPPRQRPTEDDSDTMDAKGLVNLITRLRDSGAWLGPRSEQFLDGLLARARCYDAVFLSVKQRQWLDDLARRAGVAA